MKGEVFFFKFVQTANRRLNLRQFNSLVFTRETAFISKRLFDVVIQQIRAMPIHGQNARDICHSYTTDILH